MHDILKALAAAKGWFFDYGREDFHNLINEEDTFDTYLLLDPVMVSKRRNDSGVVESLVYSGSFLLLKSSNIDETSYEFRYQNYIKTVLEGVLLEVEKELTCEKEALVLKWDITEVINMTDQNLDGCIVEYQIQIQE